jgi:hypothetical protein
MSGRETASDHCDHTAADPFTGRSGRPRSCARAGAIRTHAAGPRAGSKSALADAGPVSAAPGPKSAVDLRAPVSWLQA